MNDQHIDYRLQYPDFVELLDRQSQSLMDISPEQRSILIRELGQHAFERATDLATNMSWENAVAMVVANADSGTEIASALCEVDAVWSDNSSVICLEFSRRSNHRVAMTIPYPLFNYDSPFTFVSLFLVIFADHDVPRVFIAEVCAIITMFASVHPVQLIKLGSVLKIRPAWIARFCKSMTIGAIQIVAANAASARAFGLGWRIALTFGLLVFVGVFSFSLFCAAVMRLFYPVVSVSIIELESAVTLLGKLDYQNTSYYGGCRHVGGK